MTVVGIMSGTSADGIDVAIVRIYPVRTVETNQAENEAATNVRIKLLHHNAVAFPRDLRSAVLAAMGTTEITTPELARLNWRLGLAYAEAAQAAIAQWKAKMPGGHVDLAGCHGQTIYHQGQSARWLGRSFGCTWQIGEPALLAPALGVPVIANFRPADMAHGGQGAPLVPLLDYVLYRHPQRTRILQNIGGIGNLTVIPAGASLAAVRAFDTGPGNMIIDSLMQQLYGRSFDRGGSIAAKGAILLPVIQAALRGTFFRKAPPKSAGREQFGAAYTSSFLDQCKALSNNPSDAIATATALTAESINLVYRKFVRRFLPEGPVDYFVSGGGAKNRALMAMLRTQLKPFNCNVATLDSISLPVEAKEAAAFALLAYQTWNHRPGNVPSATGASRPAILGQVCYA